LPASVGAGTQALHNQPNDTDLRLKSECHLIRWSGKKHHNAIEHVEVAHRLQEYAQ